MAELEFSIKGWPSFNAWVAAGYPGAKSCPPLEEERPPDPRRGLCSIPDCTHVERTGKGLCIRHLALYAPR